jgi:hypothetical protein
MKITGILVFLSLLLVSIGAVNAVQVGNSNSFFSLTIPSNVNSLYNISFYNNQTTPVNISINIGSAKITYGFFFSSMGVKPIVSSIGAGQSESLLFSFNPTGKVSSLPVDLNISYTQGSVTKYFVIAATIVPIQNLISKISAPATLQPSGPLYFNVSVLNEIGQNAVIPLSYQLNNSNKQVVSSASGNIVLSSLGIDQFYFALPLSSTLAPGLYNLSVWTNYGGQQSLGYVSVHILNYFSLTKVPSSNYSIFGGSSSVTITNNGNENVSNGNLTLSISSFNSAFLASKSSSVGQALMNNGVVTTSLSALAPGQSITISYNISYWPLYLIAVIIAAAIIIFLYFNRKVVVSKEVVEHKVSSGFVDVKIAVRIRNISKKILNNLVITDSVPAHALKVSSIGPKEGKITTGYNGLNITWRETELQPNDEILLMYEIKSKLGIVGSIELTPARLTFNVDKKNYRKNSNSLVLNIH